MDQHSSAENISTRLSERIAERIRDNNGSLPFDQYMEMALYEPGLGYYVNGTRKFGESGDFVTAPELSPLFSHCLARQCAEVLSKMEHPVILEFGAGTGIMAAELLLELERLDQLPDRYLIMELSPDLRDRQQQTIKAKCAHLVDRLVWLDELPDQPMNVVVLGNEVLDAMPVQLFRTNSDGLLEAGVEESSSGLAMNWHSANTNTRNAVAHIQSRYGALPDDYQSEINLRLQPWLQTVSRLLAEGIVLLIDYGYEGAAYYHPERDTGTLICHSRHRAHDDVFYMPGLQDITANVDFSQVAEAGSAAGLDLLGYTTQANFLIGCGLDEILMEAHQSNPAEQINLLQGVKQLTLPTEMGERFKVIALGREIEVPLRGFAVRDLRGRL